MLVRCLYASRAVKPVATATLDDILDQSRKNNPARGLTGLLCHTHESFVQVIEGGREPVSRLLQAIFQDDRHQDVTLLSFEEISERRFGNWTMGRVSIDHVNPALLLKYAEKPTLDPFTGPGHATMALLLELISTGAIINRPGH
jgi:hypothetical protein